MSIRLSALSGRLHHLVACTSRSDQPLNISRSAAFAAARAATRLAPGVGSRPVSTQFTRRREARRRRSRWSCPARPRRCTFRQRQHRHRRGRFSDNSQVGAASVMGAAAAVDLSRSGKLIGSNPSGAAGHGVSVATIRRRQPASFFASSTTRRSSPSRRSSQANGATMLCIGAELDQLAGPAHLLRSGARAKAFPSRCRPTAILPSSAGAATIRTPERPGSIPAAAASGASRGRSSLPAMQPAPRSKATPWRCLPTATLLP